MELLQLYYFRTAARCENISAAARELHIAQPALSQTIRRLENELDAPLFDRTGKRIQLNECGKAFLKYTEMILNALSDAKSEVSQISENTKQHVAFGVMAASSLLPDILGKFSHQYPEIRFEIFQSTNNSRNTENIDLTLYASPVPVENEHSVILLKEPMVIALPKKHPLAKSKTLCLRELSDQAFASLYTDSNLYKITEYYFDMAGFKPKISLSCDNPQAFRELLGLNTGIALIPAITWPDMNDYGIVTRPISDFNCMRYIILSWNANRYLTPAAVIFRQFLVDYFKNL